MKKIIYLIPLLFSGFQFTSCSNSSEGKVPKSGFGPNGDLTFHITSEMAEMNVLLSELVEDYYFIHLETNPNCFISSIQGVHFAGDNLYVHDEEMVRPALRFDTKGKFLNVIGAVGEGPGQYMGVADFDIDAHEERLIVSDQISLSYFDYQGDFISTKRTDIIHSGIRVINDSLYCLMGGGEDDRIIIINKKGIQLNSRIPYKKGLAVGMNNQMQRVSDGVISYTPFFYDTIFLIQNKEVFASRIFDFGNEKFTYEDYETRFQDNLIAFLKYMRNNSISKISQYFESKDIILATIRFENRPYMMLYSKLSKETKVIDVKTIDNELLLAKSFPYGICGFYNEYLIVSVDSDFIIKKVEEFKNTHTESAQDENIYFQKLSKLASKIHDEDNPVLMLVKFKTKS
ncbi:MAG: 6-bladed beta-propeller [Bacteroidales bacterium]|nr:6-bladed beta-propeller [Bacteroidales bacterium]